MDEGDAVMRFTFFLNNAAYHNSEEAKIRESTRMAMIAYSLRKMGHDASFAEKPALLSRTSRWDFFSHIPIKNAGGFTVHSAEPDMKFYSDFLFKTSVGTSRDSANMDRCKCLIATESDHTLKSDKYLKIPFNVHDTVINDLIDDGLFQNYLDDDLDPIREFYKREITDYVGFCGCNWRFRREFFENSPDWVDCQFYSTQVMTPRNHIRWLMKFKAGVALRGDTPKTNLPALLAMLGIPIIAPEIEDNHVPLNDDAMIRFQSWEQVRSVLDDSDKLSAISENATAIYKSGWSPSGVARLVAERALA